MEWMRLLERGGPLAERARERELCRADFARFGLLLSDEALGELEQVRRAALAQTGRVELGPGILAKLAHALCDSPFLRQDNCAAVLCALVDGFYPLKAESGERFSDDELLSLLKSAFDGPADGSAERACELAAARCRAVRTGALSVREALQKSWPEPGEEDD